MKIQVLIAVLALSFSAHAEVKRSSVPLRAFAKANPCPVNGQKTTHCPGYVIDHIVPLCAGGPDAVRNLQWQEYKESLVKDRAERRQCAALRRKGL